MVPLHLEVVKRHNDHIVFHPGRDSSRFNIDGRVLLRSGLIQRGMHTIIDIVMIPNRNTSIKYQKKLVKNYGLNKQVFIGLKQISILDHNIFLAQRVIYFLIFSG
jgi:hypothetical protein